MANERNNPEDKNRPQQAGSDPNRNQQQQTSQGNKQQGQNQVRQDQQGGGQRSGQQSQEGGQRNQPGQQPVRDTQPDEPMTTRSVGGSSSRGRVSSTPSQASVSLDAQNVAGSGTSKVAAAARIDGR